MPTDQDQQGEGLSEGTRYIMGYDQDLGADVSSAFIVRFDSMGSAEILLTLHGQEAQALIGYAHQQQAEIDRLKRECGEQPHTPEGEGE